MTTKTTTHVFDYHAEPEDSFLKWAMVHFLSGRSTDEEFQTLSAVTDNFRHIELDIRVNNIAVNAAEFMKLLDQGVDNAIDRGVKQKIQESDRFDRLDEVVYQFEQDVKRAARQAVRDLGIDYDEEDYR